MMAYQCLKCNWGFWFYSNRPEFCEKSHFESNLTMVSLNRRCIVAKSVFGRSPQKPKLDRIRPSKAERSLAVENLMSKVPVLSNESWRNRDWVPSLYSEVSRPTDIAFPPIILKVGNFLVVIPHIALEIVVYHPNVLRAFPFSILLIKTVSLFFFRNCSAILTQDRNTLDFQWFRFGLGQSDFMQIGKPPPTRIPVQGGNNVREKFHQELDPSRQRLHRCLPAADPLLVSPYFVKQVYFCGCHQCSC